MHWQSSLIQALTKVDVTKNAPCRGLHSPDSDTTWIVWSIVTLDTDHEDVTWTFCGWNLWNTTFCFHFFSVIKVPSAFCYLYTVCTAVNECQWQFNLMSLKLHPDHWLFVFPALGMSRDCLVSRDSSVRAIWGHPTLSGLQTGLSSVLGL